MNCGGHGRWSLLSMTPMVLLVLGLHLQGSASRCIDTVLGQDLQPLPPGVQRCSLPSGLLQPDVLPPGQGGGSSDGGGGSRIVGGSPAVSGSYGGGSSGVGPTPQGGGPFQFGRPGKQWQWPNGRPIGPIIAGGSSQSGGPLGSGPSGSGTPPYGAGPVGAGRPGGSAQWGYPGQYGGGPGGSSSGYDGGYGPPGYIRPVAKPPSIPYIPSAREWGGGRIPLPRDSPPLNPNAPFGGGPYGGGAGSYNNPGRPYPPSTYSGESGPRGREDGSYGPEPLRMTPGSQSNTPLDRESPCKPTC